MGPRATADRVRKRASPLSARRGFGVLGRPAAGVSLRVAKMRTVPVIGANPVVVGAMDGTAYSPAPATVRPVGVPSAIACFRRQGALRPKYWREIKS